LQAGATVRYTRTNIRAYSADSPLLPSGLIGPVTLDAVYRVRLRLQEMQSAKRRGKN